MTVLTRPVAITSIVSGFMLMSFGQAHAAGPSNSWQELGPLNIGRAGCKAHSISGNQVIAIAGEGDEFGPADTSAEIFNLDTGIWSLAAPMPAGFAPGLIPWTAKLKDGYLLVAGGLSSFRETGDLRSYVYSVASDTWIKTGDLPIGASVASNFGQITAVVLDDGRALTASGLAIGVGETPASTVFTPNYANLNAGLSGESVGTWDFTRDQQGNVTRLNGASEHHKLVKLLDGRVLLIHGNDRLFRSPRGDVFRDTHGVQAELFDPATGRWTALPNLPAIKGEDDRHKGIKGVRQLASATVLADGRVLISGGFSSPADANGRPLLKDIYYVRSSSVLFDSSKFDAGAYPWSITGSMNVARESHITGQLAGQGRVIAAWGWTRIDGTATVEAYDTAKGTWTVITGLPAADGTDVPVSLPWGCSAIMPSGRMVLIGGAYDLETQGTSRRTYFYEP